MSIRIVYKNEAVSDGKMQDYVNQLVKELNKRKIKGGDFVACKASTHIGIMIQWLACLEVACIPIFIPYDYTFDLFHAFINKIAVKLLIDTNDSMQHTFHDVSDDKNRTAIKNIPAGSVIHVTSATTGNPKLVVRTKSQLEAETDRYIRHMDYSEKDVFLPLIPFCHSFGFISGMLVSIRLGAKIIIPDMILPRNIIGLCNTYQVTSLLGVPYLYSKLCEVPFKYQFNDKLRYAISSGAPMLKGLQSMFMERFGHPLLQQYGSTETGSLSISGPKDEYNNVGKPFPGVTFKINEDRNNSWIYISSPETAGAYITEDGRLEPLGRYIKLGDIGYLTESGNLIIEGRGDDVVTISGKKFSKKTVLQVIEKLAGIESADIFIRENGDFKELVCEYTSKKEISYEEIINHCKVYLPDFQIPKYCYRVDKLNKEKRHSWKEN